MVATSMASADPAAACEGRLIDSPEILGDAVCVPENPERIVVLDPTFSLGAALELGLPVIGAPLYDMSDAHLKQKALDAGVTDLGSMLEPSLERIVSLGPDLIIGTGLAGEEVRALLSDFAPTVLIAVEEWKAYYRRLASVAGRAEVADATLAEFEARAAEVRARVPDVTVSVVRITNWDFQVYLDAPNAYGPFQVLREAGVRRTDYETSTDSTTLKRPDWEALAELDGDILLYIIGGANDSDTSGRYEEVLSNPLWQMLPAVEAGRVHRVDAGTWMEFSGIAAAHRVLDDIERYMIGPLATGGQ